MRQTVAVILLIGLGVLLYFYTGNRMEELLNKRPKTEFDKVMAYDLDRDYPESIDEVMVVNNEIIEYIYGEHEDNTVLDEQLPSLVKQLRNLYDFQLKEFNPYEKHLQRIKKEIENYRTLELVIIDSKKISPEMLDYKDKTGKPLAKIKVAFITNTDTEIYIEYGLRKTDEQWKIYGWKELSERIIIE